jgi:hypothetical protein
MAEGIDVSCSICFDTWRVAPHKVRCTWLRRGHASHLRDPATEAGWWVASAVVCGGGQPGKHLKAPAYSGPPDVSAHKLTKELPLNDET